MAENDNIIAEFHLPGVEALRREEMWGMVHDDNFHTALVTGCAGSGKTTISVYRLIRLNNQGVEVRLLTLQNMLVAFIKNLVVNNTAQAVDIEKKVPFGRISTFHDWFYKQRRMSFDIDCPPSREAIHAAFQQNGFSPGMPAELLIDEGQDLPLWIYEVLPKYYSRLIVGADEAQQVKPDMPRNHVESIRGLFAGKAYQPSRHYPLGQNFRNTYETYCFARQFLPRDEFQEVWDENIVNRILMKNSRGRKPMVIPYTDTTSRNEHMRKIINNATGVVGILCPIGSSSKERYSGESASAMHQLVTSWGISATLYHNGLEPPEPHSLKRYIVTTFMSAKGLEFDTVVIPRMNFYKNPLTTITRIREEMYVACTRAKSRLYIYRDQKNPQYDPLKYFEPSTYEDIDE